MQSDAVWVVLSATISHELEDILAARLDEWTARGYEVVDSRGGQLVAQAASLEEGTILFRFYVEAPAVESALSALRVAVGELCGPDSDALVHAPEALEPGWENRWREYFQVSEVSPRLVIRPTWRVCAPRAGQHLIHLDPGAAFGTGTHATTQLMLRVLDGWGPLDQVLDLGTGSGVLAVASALLGSRRVLAVDNDALAVEVARENSFLNAVDDIVDVSLGTIERVIEMRGAAAFDGVVANIMANPLKRMATELAASVAAGGRLALTGILTDEGDAVAEVYAAQGMSLEAREHQGEWVALSFRRQ